MRFLSLSCTLSLTLALPVLSLTLSHTNTLALSLSPLITRAISLPRSLSSAPCLSRTLSHTHVRPRSISSSRARSCCRCLFIVCALSLHHAQSCGSSLFLSPSLCLSRLSLFFPLGFTLSHTYTQENAVFRSREKAEGAQKATRWQVKKEARQR